MTYKKNKNGKTLITMDSLKSIGFVEYYDYDIIGSPKTSLKYPGIRLWYWDVGIPGIRYGAIHERSEVKYIEDLLIIIEGLFLLEGGKNKDYNNENTTIVFI